MRIFLTFLAGAVVSAGAAAMMAAPQQYPGQPTQARVWVQNRGMSEAIPVDLREVNLDRPLRVMVMNGDAPASSSNPIVVRLARPTWEYRTVLLKSSDDPAQALQGPGNEGWETTGVSWPRADGTTQVLLKRSR